MINSEKVSVIIPVYGVERYLRACLDSVLAQTYNNLEIIVVNDGSLDSSPQICDEYAAMDKRIHVIHKQNGGLSSARNAGIDIARGQYITFVDSDDYIDKDMISFLRSTLVKNESDISTCGFRLVYDDHVRKVKRVNNGVSVLAANDALSDVLYGEHATLHGCGKLFKVSLFNDIRFPEGRVYEDVATTYKLISRSKKVCLGTAKKYNYLQRRDSVTGSPFSRSTLDSLHFAQEILSYIKTHHPDVVHAAESYLLSTAVAMIYLILRSNQSQLYSDEMDQCAAIISSYRTSVSIDKRANKRLRIYAYVSRISIGTLRTLLIAQSFIKRAYLVVSVGYATLRQNSILRRLMSKSELDL